MKKSEVMKAVCLLLVLATTGITAEETIFLRGNVISSEKDKQPLDSVIIRLLNSGQSVYSKKDGSFMLSDGKVMIQKNHKTRSPKPLHFKNGLIIKTGGFPDGARTSLYDLQGKLLESATYGKSTDNVKLNILNTFRKSSWSGYCILSVVENKVELTHRYLVLFTGKQIAAFSPIHERATAPYTKDASAAATTIDTLHLWKPGYKAKKIPLSNRVDSLENITIDALTEIQTAPAPLFRDPICNGAADPTIIWNPQDKAYWIFYTNRRVNCCKGCTGVQWVFGTDIGITSSFDGGATWQYRGIAKLKDKEDLNWNEKKNTFWAIEVIYHEGLFHMYASITPGILSSWNESIAGIVHLSATDPLSGWSYDKIPYTPIHQGIDPTVHKLDDGKWYMWGKFSDVLVSADLVNWKIHNSSSPRTGEAPYVFYWKDYYWIIWDPTGGTNGGLTVKRSSDGFTWTTQKSILDGAGIRSGEKGVDGKHCSVVVQGDKAYIIYFAETGGSEGSCLQTAPLEVNNGVLTADRNTPFEFILEHFDDPRNEGR